MARLATAESGRNGARVLRSFTLGKERVASGTVLTGEQVMSMPLANRRALFNTERLEAFTSATPAVEEVLDPNLGQYGGITLETVRLAGKDFPPGTRISPEVAMKWGLKNRAALQNQKRVAFFSEPVAAPLSDAESKLIDDMMSEEQ